MKIVEENIVSWGTIAAFQASMNDYRNSGIKVKYSYGDNLKVGVGYNMYMNKPSCLDHDLLLTQSIGAQKLLPSCSKVGFSDLNCSDTRQHKVSRYILSHHHGSLERNYTGDFSLLASENDSTFHSTLSNRFLVNFLQNV